MKIHLCLLAAAFAVGLLFANESSALAATNYFVDSAHGCDCNTGDSPGQAWRRFTNVTGKTFQPGDVIHLARGGVWNEQLAPRGSGTVSQPIIITSYGNASLPRPQINGVGIPTSLKTGFGGAVNLRNQANWDISELDVTNAGLVPGQFVGILIANCTGDVLNHVSVFNSSIHDVNGQNNGYYGTNAGIAVVSCVDTSKPGKARDSRWQNVDIYNNTITRTERIGVFVGPAWQDSIDDWNNWPSIPKSDSILIFGNTIDSSEDGILTFVASNVHIMNNVVRNGGQHNHACPDPAPGPPFYCNGAVAGIWTAITSQANIELNEVFNQGTASGNDGEAFDADLGTSDTTFQHNYSHDNPHGAFLFWDVIQSAPDTNLKVRYNVSYNDGTSIFTICNGFPKGLDALDIMNNVVYTSKTIRTALFSNCGGGADIPGLAYVYNNIFATPGTIAYAEYPRMADAIFDYNLYYSAGAHPANEPADAHRLTADPRFVDPTSPGIGFDSTAGLQLAAGSPAIATGTNTGVLGSTDFWQGHVPTPGSPARPSIGAYNGYDGVSPTPNLLWHARAVASSSYNVSPWGIANAFDGQQGSWNDTFGYSSQPSSASTTQWIEINLTSQRTFNQIVLCPRANPGQVGVGFPIDFQIQVWDGARWLTRVSKTGYPQPSSAPQTFTWGFSDWTDRIRIVGSNLRRDDHGDFVMQFAEIEAHQID